MSVSKPSDYTWAPFSESLSESIRAYTAQEFQLNPLMFLWLYWDRIGSQQYSPGIVIWDGE